MEIKLFGKSLFSSKKSRADQIVDIAMSSDGEDKGFIPDFYKLHNRGNSDLSGLIAWTNESGTLQAVGNNPKGKGKGKKVAKKPVKPVVEKPKITPKGVFNLKTLNKGDFVLNTNEAYVDGQIEDFKNKLAVLQGGDWDMRNGIVEVKSIILRMENRKKYAEHKAVFEDFAYTTTGRIDEMLKTHDHLQMGNIGQFVADLPKEASDVMKKYNDACKALCGKQTFFYIIADKKDFKRTEKRRDPILLAQSPFGHVWQILGAWDDEVLIVDEL